MTKAELLRSVNSCLSRAADDEPVFVLRAKDPLAAQTLRLWASMARGVHEDDKVELAREEAEQMDAWRAQQFPPKTEARKTTFGVRANAVVTATGGCGE